MYKGHFLNKSCLVIKKEAKTTTKKRFIYRFDMLFPIFLIIASLIQALIMS